MLFDIYYGLSGGFGGATYHGTEEFEDEEQAEKYACECACDEYSSYEGLYGLKSYVDCEQDAIEEFGDDYTDEDVDDFYRDEVEEWIDYYVVPHAD